MPARNHADHAQKLHIAVEWLREFRLRDRRARRVALPRPIVTRHEVKLARFLVEHGNGSDRALARWFLPHADRRKLAAEDREAKRILTAPIP